MKRLAKVVGIVLALVMMLQTVAFAGEGSELVYEGPEMTLSFSFGSGEEVMKIYVDVCERISERTGGKVKFDYYYGGSLAAAAEALDACGSGLADLADITLTNTPDRFPYSQQVTGYPFLGFTSFNMAADIMRRFIPSNEYCMAEFDAANIVPLFFTGVWGTSVVTRDDSVITTPADLAGKKMMVSSETEARFLIDAGGTPISQPPTEMYSAMQNGVTDGIIFGLYVIDIFGALQLAKNVSVLEKSFTTGCRAFCINKDLWDSFDPVLQQIFTEEFGGEELWNTATAYWLEQDQMHLDNCEEWGIPVVNITGEDMDAWVEMAKPYGEAKMQELYDAGNEHVYEVLDELNAAIENYDGEWK